MVHFFRIADRGSISKPTIMGIVVFFAYMILIMALLRDSIVMALLLIGLGYVIIIPIFARPLRYPIGKMLYQLRNHNQTSVPSNAHSQWYDTNKETLKRARLRVFNGDSHE